MQNTIKTTFNDCNYSSALLHPTTEGSKSSAGNGGQGQRGLLPRDGLCFCVLVLCAIRTGLAGRQWLGEQREEQQRWQKYADALAGG